MNRILLAAIAAAGLSLGLIQAKETSPVEKFYGKVVTINHKTQTLTAFNKKRKLERNFKWNSSTKMVFMKNPISGQDLKKDQFLIISYVSENDKNIAKRITVRKPYQRRN